MDRVCPRCRGTTPHNLCPRCGIKTTEVSVGPTVAEVEATSTATALLIGILLAQGLYYSLFHLVTAGILARDGPAALEEFRDSLNGLVVRQGLQALALIVGCMLAAAGRRGGIVIGIAVGLVNAMLLIGLQSLLRSSGDDLIWLGQPLLHAFVGAAGGVIGSWIWQPPPLLAPLTGDGRVAEESLTIVLPDRVVDNGSEPWPWQNIAIGVLVAVGGTVGARYIRELVVVAGGGTGREMQSQLITWEIALIAQVIGGVVAGAGTRGGVLYGFWVGLPAAIILAICQSVPELRVPIQVLPDWLTGGASSDGGPIVLALQAIQAVMLGALGGWLGGLILPADPRRRLRNED